ncbi:MAG: RHS repeat-associated protein [Paraglaciecola sp.]|jgi:RHS repeat-associated protein
MKKNRCKTIAIILATSGLLMSTAIAAKKPKSIEQKRIDFLSTRTVNNVEVVGLQQMAVIGGGGGGNIFTSVMSEDITARLNVHDAITADNTDLLGDRVDLNTGAVSFNHTDIVIPTNSGLKVGISRTFRDKSYTYRNMLSFGDWQLDVPSIHTTLLYNNSGFSGSWGDGNECTGNLNPGIFNIQSSNAQYDSFEYYNGTTLNVPGKVNDKLLSNNGTLTAPTTTYKKVTTSNWRVSCFNRADGLGEGFIAQSPDGTRYTFDEYRLTQAPPLKKDNVNTARYHAFMQVSKVEDKFGNIVSYNYNSSGELTSIVANNGGPTISLSYTAADAGLNVISSITANGRTWTYQYTGRSLKKVILPDGRQWQYNLDLLASQAPSSRDNDRCSFTNASTSTYVNTITHPNGVVGEFSIKETLHGRSQVPDSWDPGSQTNLKPHCFATMSLIQKKLMGTGIPTLIWDYDYSQNIGTEEFVTPPSAALLTGSLPANINNVDYRRTTVTAPDDSKTVYYHNRDWGDVLDGINMATDYFDTNGSTLLKRIEKTVVTGTKIGSTHMLEENLKPLEYRTNTTKVKTSLYLSGGTDVFTSTRSNFDTYGNPQTVIESGNAGSRTKSLTYYNSASKWVLGVPDNVTIGSDLSVTRNHNSYGQVTSETNNGVTNTYTYTAALLASQKNANNKTTSFSNYYRGVPANISYPIGSITTAVDYFGNITRITNQNGNPTYYAFDTNNRTTNINYPQGNDVSIAYATNSYTKTQGSYQEVHSLDALNRNTLTTFKDNTNSITRYQRNTFDAYNRNTFSSVKSTSSGEGVGTSTTYDGLGRVKTSTSVLGSQSFVYKSANKVSITDGNGNTTTQYLTGYGSPSTSFVVKTDTPSSSGTISTVLNKNTVGKLSSVTQGGKAISYGYHTTYKNYVTSETHPSFTITMGRDAVGNMTTRKVGSSSTTSFGYDNNNRLTSINYPSGTADVSFTYRGTGEMLTATNGVGNITWGYDSLNRVISRNLSVDGSTYNFSYNYDNNSNLTSINYPTGIVSYSPNLFNEPKQAGSFASSVQYHPTGVIKSFTYGNGLTYTGGVDSSKVRLNSIVHKNGSTKVINKAYGYDANSNVTSISDSVKSTYAVTGFSYDGADRLLGASSSAWGGATSFAYDKIGNITSKVTSGTTNTYSYGTDNLLDSITGNKNYSFTYDTYGNVTDNGHHSFNYNDAGQMTSASGGGDTKSFAYDALGKRVKVTTNSQTEIEIHNDDGKLMWLKDANGVEHKKVYLGSNLIAQYNHGTATNRYMHFDALGSVIAKSDSNKSMTYEHYHPFGEKVENPAGTENKQWYAGHSFDDELDIIYMQARYYDPVIGRFYSNDPVGFRDIHSFNRYAYGNNNPYKYIDPNGMASEPIWTRFDSAFDGIKNFVSFSSGAQKIFRDSGATVVPNAILTRDSNAKVIATLAGFGLGPYALAISGAASLVDLYQTGSLASLTGAGAGEFVNKAGEKAKGKAKALVWAAGIVTGTVASSNMADTENERTQEEQKPTNNDKRKRERPTRAQQHQEEKWN